MSTALAPVAAAQDATIVFDAVSKWYGDVIGVNQISLRIRPGITGLLGPNGAGKSTLMKLVTGQLKPGSGTVRVTGRDPWRSPDVFRRTGYCPDTDAFYEDLSGLEFVTLMSRLAGMNAHEGRRRTLDAVERVGMTAHMTRPIRGYSKGMRQRIKLAAALVHDPQVLVLDEPLNGLDITGRRDFLRLFRALGAEGRTLLVSSHILHEIESLTQEIALIHHGRVLADGHIGEIRRLIEDQPLTLQVTTPSPREIGRDLAGMDHVYSVTYPEPGLVVTRTNRPDTVYEALQAGVLDGRYLVDGLLALDDSLDAVFSYLVKE
jgi:ABC-2 type transport system ATP-binding protein